MDSLQPLQGRINSERNYFCFIDEMPHRGCRQNSPFLMQKMQIKWEIILVWVPKLGSPDSGSCLTRTKQLHVFVWWEEVKCGLAVERWGQRGVQGRWPQWPGSSSVAVNYTEATESFKRVSEQQLALCFGNITFHGKDWDANWCSHYGKQYGGSSKK